MGHPPAVCLRGAVHRGAGAGIADHGLRPHRRNGQLGAHPKYPDLTYEDGTLALAVEEDGSATGFDPATCAEIFHIEGGEGAYYAAYDGVVQAFDAEKTCLYDYAGRLVCEGSAQASYVRGENGQFILTDGPWGAACCRIVRADGTLVEGAWQSLFPLLRWTARATTAL